MIALGGVDDLMFDWLAKTSGQNPLSNEEKIIFFTQFSNFVNPTRMRILTIFEARKLVSNIRAFIKSKTVAALMQEGFVFDGFLSQGGAEGKALLYNVIDIASGRILCAKVYSVIDTNDSTISNEIEKSILIHKQSVHPHIVQYLRHIQFGHLQTSSFPMIALLMPKYELSLSEILDAFMDNPLSIEIFRKLTLHILDATSRFESVGLSHSDVKPQNIMIQAENFVLIDLGASCQLGSAATEYTPGYFLDADANHMTPQFDLNCIIVTLAKCCMKEFTPKLGMTREAFIDTFNTWRKLKLAGSDTTKEKLYVDVIQILLSHVSSTEALRAVSEKLCS